MSRWCWLALAAWCTGAAANAAGQGTPVVLQIRPQAGDTIRLRLDQTVEITGPAAGVPEAAVGAKPPAETGTLVLLATLAIESADDDGATVVSVTDSVRLNAVPGSGPAAVLAWAAAAASRAVRFRVSPDGSASLPNSRGQLPPPGAMVSQIPASLPRKPIAPGASWTSAMQVPLASSMDPGGMARLTATFTFDSLSKSGELAFLSLRGRLMKGESGAEAPGRAAVETSGTVTGQILVDRRRGWITDARTTFSLQSLVYSATRSAAPVKVRMVISQWLRAM